MDDKLKAEYVADTISLNEAMENLTELTVAYRKKYLDLHKKLNLTEEDFDSALGQELLEETNDIVAEFDSVYDYASRSVIK